MGAYLGIRFKNFGEKIQLGEKKNVLVCLCGGFERDLEHIIMVQSTRSYIR